MKVVQVELRFNVQFEMKNSRFRKFNVSFGFVLGFGMFEVRKF